jgi:hypothetical protein
MKKIVSEAEQYQSLLARAEEQINLWRGLAHEAHKRGDDVGVWEAGANIRDLERRRDTMRKPNLTEGNKGNEG